MFRNSIGVARRERSSSVICRVCLSAFAAAAFSVALPAQSDIDVMKKEIEALKRSDTEKSQKIAELERQVGDFKARDNAGTLGSPESELEKAVRDLGNSSTSFAGGPSSPPSQRLIDVSLVTTTIVGTSTATDAQLADLEGGDHDPSRRGFRVPNTELSLSGNVDPYFRAEAHIVYKMEPDSGETGIELEEAFVQTTSLPWGLQVEAGQSFLEFGRVNPQHPHSWEFIDQPVINTRLFGGDGLRSQGVRLGWLLPIDWFSELHLGVYNADGETLTSFFANDEVYEERPIGGRAFVEQDNRDFGDFVYLMRLDNSWDLSSEFTLKVGASALYGPNATGTDGDTWIYGADILLKWRPVDNERGWPFVIWQTEIMKRDFDADSFVDEGDPLDPLDDVSISGDDLEDFGLYTQLIWGFTPGWLVGARFEWADGHGQNFDIENLVFTSRRGDPYRDERYRASALVSYMPTEFSKFRLQYNFDTADHLDDDAHSVWFSLEVIIGTHAAHTY